MTIAEADAVTDVLVYSIHDLNISSPSYADDLLEILNFLKAHNVETIYGCSYTALCLEVIFFTRSHSLCMLASISRPNNRL